MNLINLILTFCLQSLFCNGYTKIEIEGIKSEIREILKTKGMSCIYFYEKNYFKNIIDHLTREGVTQLLKIISDIPNQNVQNNQDNQDATGAAQDGEFIFDLPDNCYAQMPPKTENFVTQFVRYTDPSEKVKRMYLLGQFNKTVF